MGDFAIRLKKLRTERQLTQDELAPELGISRSTLGMYETGKREPDFETLETIADFFNVDMNYLIGYSDNPRDWEQIANEQGIAPSNDFDGDPEDWFNMKMTTDDDYIFEKENIAQNDTERRLLMLYRKAGDVSEDEKEAIINQFEATIDMYLKAKGIKKE